MERPTTNPAFDERATFEEGAEEDESLGSIIRNGNGNGANGNSNRKRVPLANR